LLIEEAASDAGNDLAYYLKHTVADRGKYIYCAPDHKTGLDFSAYDARHKIGLGFSTYNARYKIALNHLDHLSYRKKN